ncbi:MAG: 3-deoxy-7-phosphoheptulonate synthase [Bacillales bacterium]|nr:3-deoxy-7-phosphoheptulonate synthase [Bacillales bacterium]
MNMNFKRKLPIPKEVKAMYPLSEELAKIKKNNDQEIQDIFLGKSNKLLLIIGPCSADREDAVLDYMHRLRKVQEQVKDVIVICPRVYTNKPRTNGSGYKGMLHQPDPTMEPDMLKGIIAIRELHMRVLLETGFSCADEMLYPENHRYLSDLLSYVAVGARSVENQQHRLTASGLNVPVGMKNPTSGDLMVMMNSINAGQHGHTFIYRGWEVESKGNPLTHAILRGYVDEYGNSYANYHYEDLKKLSDLYDKCGFVNPAVIVDCNHSNSSKKYEEQIRIAKEILHSTRHNEKIHSLVKGLMIESYLVDGCQNIEEGIYGKSITDPCLGWEKTEKLILDLAYLRRNEKNKDL